MENIIHALKVKSQRMREAAEMRIMQVLMTGAENIMLEHQLDDIQGRKIKVKSNSFLEVQKIVREVFDSSNTHSKGKGKVGVCILIGISQTLLN